MTSKHYPQYLKEYKNQEYLELDQGFVAYEIMTKPKVIMVQDLYVVPEKRGRGVAFELLDLVTEIGAHNECTNIVGFVRTENPCKEAVIKSMISYGGKIIAMDRDKLTLAKEI